MLCHQSTHEWLGRFAVRLMQLRQDISLPHAVKRAVVVYGQAFKPSDAGGGGED